MRRKFRPIVRTIASCAFCDNGTDIALDDIDAALDIDRASGLNDPSAASVRLLVQGGPNGAVPIHLRRAHPALDALLTMEMT